MQNTLKKVNCIYDLSFIVQLKFVHSLQCSYVCMMITGNNPVKYYFSGLSSVISLLYLIKVRLTLRLLWRTAPPLKKLQQLWLDLQTNVCDTWISLSDFCDFHLHHHRSQHHRLFPGHYSIPRMFCLKKIYTERSSNVWVSIIFMSENNGQINYGTLIR